MFDKVFESLKQKTCAVRRIAAEENKRKYLAAFAVILAVTLVCEIFVFNYKFWGSAFDKEIAVSEGSINLKGAEKNGDKIKITADSAEVEITDINKELKYIYLNPGDEGSKRLMVAAISAKDAANNSTYLAAPSRNVYSETQRSKYIRLHFSGEVKALKIGIGGMKGASLEDLRLNVHVPMMFSFARFLFLFLALSLLYLLRPRSFIYRYKTNLMSNKQRIVVIAVVIVQAVVYFNMFHYNTAAIKWHKTLPHHLMYYNQVEAWKDGRLDVGEASDELKGLENPYDTREREKLEYKWDHAYYNGKYYVYFGALPLALLYLPYNLLTGGNLPHYIAVYILAIMCLIGILLLLWEIIKKWFRNTPFAIYLVLSSVFAAAGFMMYAVYVPSFYIVPNLASIMFALFGLAFWLSAEKEQDGETALVPWRLALGSLFIACTALCRPQFLLAAVLGIILFWGNVFKKRDLFSKNSIKQTLAVCLPFVIVGAITMCYNAARFSSPFDFGASYNLTTNDMTKRGFVFGRIGLGIFTYFLQLPVVNAVFPFLHDFSIATAYQGLTLTEKLLGGVLWLYPILNIGVCGAFKKNLFIDRRAYRTVYCSLIIAVILAVLDAQVAGLLTRYFLDFVWLMMIASSMTVFAYFERYRTVGVQRSRAIAIVITLSVITAVVAYLTIFARSEDAIINANPELYYNMMHLIAFWL